MSGIDTNILMMIAIGVVVLALLAWLLLRGRDAKAPTQRPQEPRAPLEPNKPEIELAKPVSFAMPAPEPAPVPTAAAAPAIAAAVGEPDDLKRIKGLGPKLATLLAALGVTRFDQIAAWSEADIAAIDAHLGQFAGRIVRDNWVEQARLLAAGDEAGFAARFGSLG